MWLKRAEWTLLSVVTEGEALAIEGTDVWWHEWQSLDIGRLTVRHPSYRNQLHKLSAFAIEPEGETILFCAGELSNGVWCFHVPVKGQPSRVCAGMTVNERLFETKRSDAFDRAIRDGNERRAKHLLIATGLPQAQAAETVGAIFANPRKYGY